MQVIYRKTAR